MWSAIVPTPKRHFLAWLRVIWVIVRENPPKDHFSRRVRGKIFGVISQVDGRPPVLTAISQSNGEWSNFDPSQNQIPLTDYDKTLHNGLCPRDEHVTQNLCQLTLRERLGKYVKYKALSFLFWFIFLFSGLAYWSDPWTDFHAECLKLRAITKGSAFWGLHDGLKHLEGQITQKPSKLGVNMLRRASQLRVNEDWRHTRMTSLARCSVAA